MCLGLSLPRIADGCKETASVAPDHPRGGCYVESRELPSAHEFKVGIQPGCCRNLLRAPASTRGRTQRKSYSSDGGVQDACRCTQWPSHQCAEQGRLRDHSAFGQEGELDCWSAVRQGSDELPQRRGLQRQV